MAGESFLRDEHTEKLCERTMLEAGGEAAAYFGRLRVEELAPWLKVESCTNAPEMDLLYALARLL